MQIGHIICKEVSFELIISKNRGTKPKRKEIAIVLPTPKYAIGNFSPVAILSTYLASWTKMPEATDSNFLFPNQQSIYEPGTKRQILTM